MLALVRRTIKKCTLFVDFPKKSSIFATKNHLNYKLGMKTKQMMTAAAMFCCAMVMAVLTACSMDDNPVTPTYDKIVGRWYADASGTTYALWIRVIQLTIKADSRCYRSDFALFCF